MLVRVESAGCSALGVDCPEGEFRTIEASLYQVLHRTTGNEPVRVVQHILGMKEMRSTTLDRETIQSEEHV